MKTQKGKFVTGIIISSLLLGGIVLADTTPWTSEEYPPSTCQPFNAVFQMECNGSKCDNVRFVCDTPSKAKTSSSWTSYKSEEQGYNQCSTGAVVTGVDCQGSNCDNLSIQCTYLSGASIHNCTWVGPFSEEPPVNYGYCGTTAYMTGLFCSGSNCDNKWLYCCDI